MQSLFETQLTFETPTASIQAGGATHRGVAETDMNVVPPLGLRCWST